MTAPDPLTVAQFAFDEAADKTTTARDDYRVQALRLGSSAAAVSSATDIRRLADAIERIAEHVTRDATPDPDDGGPVGEVPPSLVRLDWDDEVNACARHLVALFDADAMRQSFDWWQAYKALDRAVKASR